MSNNVGADTWNLISGTVGVLTVLPFIWAFVRYQHPETKMAELDSALKDTEALLRSVSEEGLLDPQRHVPHFTSHLTQYVIATSISAQLFANAITDIVPRQKHSEKRPSSSRSAGAKLSEPGLMGYRSELRPSVLGSRRFAPKFACVLLPPASNIINAAGMAIGNQC